MDNLIKKGGEPKWETIWSGTSAQNGSVSAPIGDAIAVRVTYYNSNGYGVGGTGVTGACVGYCFGCSPNSGNAGAGVCSCWYCDKNGVSYRTNTFDYGVKIKKIECIY